MKGFTLLELLITVAILALLASVALPLAEVTVQRGKEQELRRALREIREAIDAYKRAADDGGIDKPADKSGYPPSLAALVEGAVDKRDPKGARIYFLRRVPADALAHEPWALRSYASPPDAPSSGEDVFDVHSKSDLSGLNGVP
ncbi:MAG: type II secretion system protein, partial [Burkholderiales bacterium]